MAKLIYATPTSLDGYIADDGNFEWSAPDVLRPVDTYLYGRKTYQTMAVWETPDVIPGLKPAGLSYLFCVAAAYESCPMKHP
jgi:dihydrofolate reductase